MDNFDFFGLNLPKNRFWGWNFKNLSLDPESTPPKYHVSQFSVKMDEFYFFDLNLGKLPNYMEYCGSNIAEGVADSWVEAEMSWVEVSGARVEVDGAECRWVHGLVITYIQNILLQCIWFTYICNEQTHIYTYTYIYIYIYIMIFRTKISRTQNCFRCTSKDVENSACKRADVLEHVTNNNIIQQ